MKETAEKLNLRQAAHVCHNAEIRRRRKRNVAVAVIVSER
jgi:hypothetical protein